jgi:GTPase
VQPLKNRDERFFAVQQILGELDLFNKPRLVVWNKADKITAEDADTLVSHAGGFVTSSHDRETFGPLLLAIERELWHGGKQADIYWRQSSSA